MAATTERNPYEVDKTFLEEPRRIEAAPITTPGVVASSNPYQASSYTSEMISDPTLRNLVSADIQRRAAAGTLGVPNYAEMAQQEISTVKQGITAFGEAERITTQREMERELEKRGVLIGGGAISSMLAKKEEIRLKEMGLLSEAEREILARYGGYSEAERGRQLQERQGTEQLIYGGAGILAQTGGGVQEALIGAGAQVQTASIGAGAQAQVATIAGQYGIRETELGGTIAQVVEQIRGRVELEIGEIQRDTTLTAKEKDTQIAEINAQVDKDVAGINAAAGIQAATIGATVQERIANIRAAADERMNRIQADTTLAEADKRIQIAGISAQADKDVAEISGRVGVQIAGISAAAQVQVAGISAMAQTQVATIAGEYGIKETELAGTIAQVIEQIRGKVDLEVAGIQKDTTLTAKEKDVEIAKLNSQGNKDIAEINRAAGIEVATIGAIVQERIAGIEAEAYKTVAEANTASAERIAAINASTALSVEDKRIQIAREHNENAVDIAYINTQADSADLLKQLASAETIADVNNVSEENIARIQGSFASAVAEINKETAENVAAVEASTTLSVAEKQENIARIRVTADENIAMAYTLSDQAIAKALNETNLAIASRQATTSENVARMSVEAQKFIAGKELLQRALEFKTTEMDAEGNPRWLVELNSANVREMNTYIGEDGKEVSEPWSVTIAREQFSNIIETTDMTITANSVALTKQIKSAMDLKIIDTDTAKAIAREQFANVITTTDMTNTANTGDIALQIESARSLKILDTEAAKDMQLQALQSADNQFFITSGREMEQWLGNKAEMVRQFNLNAEDARIQFAEALELKWEELRLAGLGNQADILLAFAKSPLWESLSDEADEPERLAQVMFNIIMDSETSASPLSPEEIEAKIKKLFNSFNRGGWI